MTPGDDTIFAPATGAGRAGVAIVRISGSGALAALRELSGRMDWVPRRATGVRLRDAGGGTLDHALAVWFPGPASFTGEDVAELHVHGGAAVVAGVLDALAERPGLRLAEPGEFTRRSFDHGKLDLTQVEGLADLVSAQTSAQRRQALRQMEGVLGGLYAAWRADLLRACALMEACIDFADEDVPTGLDAESRDIASRIAAEIRSHLNDGGRGERLREGFRVVLAGAPNVGKSSLLNALAGREVAIVDPTPGTTRDIVEVMLDLGGLPVVVADTAGLRATMNGVEREGVRRARARAAEADLCVAVFDGEVWPAQDGETRALLGTNALAVVNKGDLGRVGSDARIGGVSAVVVSAKTGDGLDQMLSDLERRLRTLSVEADRPVLTRVRHRQALSECVASLTAIETVGEVELVAEGLRQAAAALGRITGQMGVEEMLGAIFREFCIGK